MEGSLRWGAGTGPPSAETSVCSRLVCKDLFAHRLPIVLVCLVRKDASLREPIGHHEGLMVGSRAV